jgi:hypothetical protein
MTAAWTALFLFTFSEAQASEDCACGPTPHGWNNGPTVTGYILSFTDTEKREDRQASARALDASLGYTFNWTLVTDKANQNSLLSVAFPVYLSTNDPEATGDGDTNQGVQNATTADFLRVSPGVGLSMANNRINVSFLYDAVSLHPDAQDSGLLMAAVAGRERLSIENLRVAVGISFTPLGKGPGDGKVLDIVQK